MKKLFLVLFLVSGFLFDSSYPMDPKENSAREGVEQKKDKEKIAVSEDAIDGEQQISSEECPIFSKQVLCQFDIKGHGVHCAYYALYNAVTFLSASKTGQEEICKQDEAQPISEQQQKRSWLSSLPVIGRFWSKKDNFPPIKKLDPFLDREKFNNLLEQWEKLAISHLTGDNIDEVKASIKQEIVNECGASTAQEVDREYNDRLNLARTNLQGSQLERLMKSVPEDFYTQHGNQILIVDSPDQLASFYDGRDFGIISQCLENIHSGLDQAVILNVGGHWVCIGFSTSEGKIQAYLYDSANPGVGEKVKSDLPRYEMYTKFCSFLTKQPAQNAEAVSELYRKLDSIIRKAREMDSRSIQYYDVLKGFLFEVLFPKIVIPILGSLVEQHLAGEHLNDVEGIEFDTVAITLDLLPENDCWKGLNAIQQNNAKQFYADNLNTSVSLASLRALKDKYLKLFKIEEEKKVWKTFPLRSIIHAFLNIAAFNDKIKGELLDRKLKVTNEQGLLCDPSEVDIAQFVILALREAQQKIEVLSDEDIIKYLLLHHEKSLKNERLPDKILEAVREEFLPLSERLMTCKKVDFSEYVVPS